MGTLTWGDEANSSLGQGPYTHNLHPRCQSQPATSRSRRSPSSSAICCLGLGSTCSRLLLLVSRWRSRRPPWQPTEVIPLLLIWPEFGVGVVFLASTKVSSHGPGLKPPRRALSSSLLPPRENTTLVPSALVTSPLESAVVSWEVSHRHTPQWDSAPACRRSRSPRRSSPLRVSSPQAPLPPSWTSTARRVSRVSTRESTQLPSAR